MKCPLKHWIVALALLLFVTWMGARRLNTDGFWYDEWWALYNAGASDFGPPLSPVDIWNRVADEDPWQIPGYFWALSAWGNNVGWSEYAGRTLSLLAGVLAVAVVYRLGWTISGQPLVGLGAAIALGGSTWFIYYLHEMRVYAIYTLLMALLLLLYDRIMNQKHPPGIPLYAAFMLTAAALLYCHYFAVIPLAVVGLWHLARLLRRQPDRRWWITLACLALAGLALSPWLNHVFEAMKMAQRAQRIPSEGVEVLTIVGEILYAFSNTSMALLALLAVFSLGQRAARGLWLLAGAILVGSLAAYQAFSIREIRYIMGLMPLLALIAGFGFQGLAARGIHPLILACIWIAGALLVDGDYRVNSLMNRTPPQPIREMAAVLVPHINDSDVVINHLGSDMFALLHTYSLRRYFEGISARLEVVEIKTLPSVQAYAGRVREAVGEAQRVWVIYDPRSPSLEWSLFVYLLNEQNIYQCATLADTENLRVLGFGHISDSTSVARFGHAIEAQLISAPNIQGDVLTVWLGFRIGQTIPLETYSLELQIVDDTGTLRAQYDYYLPAADRSCRMVEIPVQDLPPGRYDLNMVVYDGRSSERLDVIGFDGLPGDSSKLALITR